MSTRVNIAAAVSARVLVVDDSPVIRQAIKKMLKGDFDVVLAEDGEMAWQNLMQDEQIKLLITDIEMPRLDGYAFICRIRASEDPRIRDLPVITITGAEDEEIKARAYACGATDFITKPLEAAQLHARVQAYVKFEPVGLPQGNGMAEPGAEPVTDALTKLPSGGYLIQKGKQDLAAAISARRDVSLIRLSIDNFKKIYTQHGEEVINPLLVWLAKILSSLISKEDIVARIGAAEFVLLANGTGRNEALALCDGLRSAVARAPFTYKKTSLPISISMGLVTLSVDKQKSIEEMLKLAEQRLSHAKSEGGDRVSVTDLSAIMPEAEELTIAAPEGASAAPDPEVKVEGLSVEELEEMIKHETQKAKYTGPERRAPGSLPADVVHLLSVDKALQMLAAGETAKVLPYLEGLVAQVIPLLEFYDKKRQLGLEAVLDFLRQKSSKKKR